MTRLSYENLEAWQRAMDLTCETYRISGLYPTDERFTLTSQIRRAAISVPSNIAEGSGRSSRRELLHHLSIARGSLKELETQLELSVRLGYVSRDQIALARDLCGQVSRLLHGLRRKLDP